MTAKDLKNALLQEAVQGRLVPQIASEGNARDLLEEIRKEKLSHGLDLRLEASLAINAKSGKRKSKKETALAGSNPCDITEEEITFEIPENWCWCRLGEICNLTSGQDLIPEQYNSQNKGIPYITGASNFSNENIIVNRWTEYARAIAEENDLLLTCKGTVGEMAFLHEKKVHIARQVMGLHFNKKIDSRYMKYFITTQINNLKSKAKSMIPGIARDDVIKLTIPLPPLAEQKRIVAAIEKFMPLIEEYDKKETQLKAINEKIGALTKKAILQEAVQGKLVPQIASEGNARDLLEDIRKEKLSHGLDFANAKSGKRKSKKETALAGSNPCDITEEEIPFDIPESWCWCRLGEIGDWKAGSTPSRSNPELYNGNIPWLKTGDLTDGDINEIPECISKKALESCSMRLNPIGSVLIAMYGATIGKLGILKIEATTNQACCACVPYNGIYNKYLFYYLMSQKKDFTEKAEGGAQPNISREKLVVHLLPLPPYEEQKRIVDTIEKMLPLCEKLGE